MKLFHHVSSELELQSEQITELLRIIEHQSNHLEQYRAVLDTQRESNINLNADCERIQARYRPGHAFLISQQQHLNTLSFVQFAI